jgi:CubicO group peptidase (beta-lactamase class C family)
MRNPYADYSVNDLYQFLSSYELPRDPGSEFEYSNLGGGLLGHILAHRSGTDYDTLVRVRITEPLGMTDTGITLSSSMR